MQGVNNIMHTYNAGSPFTRIEHYRRLNRTISCSDCGASKPRSSTTRCYSCTSDYCDECSIKKCPSCSRPVCLRCAAMSIEGVFGCASCFLGRRNTREITVNKVNYHFYISNNDSVQELTRDSRAFRLALRRRIKAKGINTRSRMVPSVSFEEYQAYANYTP